MGDNMNGLAVQSLTPHSLTWDTARGLFALRCRAQNISPKTLEHYTWTLELFQRFLADNGSPSPAEVTPHHIRGALDAWKAAGRASETVESRFRHLRTFFRFLHRDGLLLLAEPTGAVERPRVERRLI